MQLETNPPIKSIKSLLTVSWVFLRISSRGLLLTFLSTFGLPFQPYLKLKLLLENRLLLSSHISVVAVAAVPVGNNRPQEKLVID
jgi:hypothetical protein